MKTLALLAAFLVASAAFAADAPAPSPLAPQILDTKDGGSRRAADFEEALARAKATGKDIAVFQYGSDWNGASLSLHQNAWSKDALVRTLGPGFVVLAVDSPEVVGGRALYGRCTAEKCGLAGYSDTAIGNAPPMHLEALAKAEPPANEITALASEGGVPFAKQADGTWAVDGIGQAPTGDVLTFKVKLPPGEAAQRLEIAFPTDPALPAKGPGAAGNGNSVIGRIDILRGQRKFAPKVLSSVSQSGGGRVAAKAFEEPRVQGDARWNAEDSGWELGVGKEAKVVLDLGESVPGGTELTIRIDARTKWGQHVPGSFRCSVPAATGDAGKSCRILAASSETRMPFAVKDDGGLAVIRMAPNPPTDTLVLRVKPAKTGTLLRLDFPTDDAFPNGGPGRAGNAVISEIEMAQDGRPVKATYAWGSANAGNGFGPWTAIDGDAARNTEGWNLLGSQHQRRTLLLALEKPATAGAELTVKLVCKSAWAGHVPGAVRACVLANADALADVKKVAEAQLRQYRNRGFTFAGWGKMPRLSLFDAQGRPVGADLDLAVGLSPAAFAAKVHVLRARREKRDALWARADKTQGPAKAELLRQGLDAMNLGRDPEFGRHNGWGGGANGPYEAIHKLMKEADPKDDSGAVRWLGFSQGAWGGVPWRQPVKDAAGAVTQPGNEWWKVLEGKAQPTDADYAAAEACIDRELADPRNKLLENDHRQHILKAKYDLFLRQAKGNHEDEKVLAVQRKIAAIDPETFWGVGAVGYLGMYRRGENPFLAYGFSAKYQAKAGKHAWTLADAWKEINHPGPYTFTVTYQGGKDALKITRATVVVDGRPCGQGTPAPGGEILDAGHRTVTIPFTCTAPITKGTKALLQVEYEAQTDGLDLVGGLTVEPALVDE